MTAPSNRCPQCGQATRGGSLERLCPGCVARLSMAPAADRTTWMGSDDRLDVEDCRGLDDLLPAHLARPEPPARTHRATAPPTGSTPAGQPFGRYELLGEIGRGGMGIVHRARQIGLNRIVALKMIPFGTLASETAIRRFRAEAEATARLHHPNIVAIHDVGEQDRQHYFSMDYVPGGTLAAAWRDGPWAAERAADCLETVARAVQHAHEAGILHRDLKPSNILVDEQGQPQVTDFGLARSVTGDSSLTLTGQVLGSPNYMPPEQAGTNIPPSPASDVYSLGAVLYHALTGGPPFQAESIEAVLARLAVEDPVPIRLLNPSVPRDLETICLKCLAKEPSRRYATAAELAEELGRFRRNEPIRAKPAGAVEKAWRWCRRRPALASTLALLVLVGLIGTGGIVWQWRQAVSARAKTESAQITTARHLYAADMALAYRAFAAGDRGRARQLLAAYQSPSSPQEPIRAEALGPGVAPTVHSSRLRGWEWSYLWRQCQGDEKTILARHGGAVTALDYSPDGRWLASGDVRGGLQIWDAVRRVPVLSTNLPEGRINSLAFSADSSLLAHTTARRHVGVWDTRVSPWRRVATLAQADVSELAFAPNGRRLATVNGIEVILWNLESFLTATNDRQARIIPASRGRRQPRHLAFSADGQILAIADANGVVVYWDLSSDAEQAGWRAHRPAADATATSDAIEFVAFSPVQRLLATAGADHTVRLWTAPQRYRMCSNHAEAVTSATFSPDGRRLISTSLDQTVRLWDVATQQELAAWQGHAGGALRARFAPDGLSFASAGLDGTVKLWTTEARPPETNVLHLPAEVRDVVLFADPPSIAATLAGKEWRIWELPSLRERHHGQRSPNTAASLKAAGHGYLVEFAGDSAQVLNTTNSHPQARIQPGIGDVLSVDLSPRGDWLALSGVNGVAAWHVTTQTERRRWLMPVSGWSRHVRLAPDNATVVTLHEHDGTVTFHDAASGQVSSVAGHSIAGAVLAFSRDARLLATAGTGADVQLYDVRQRASIGTLRRSNGSVASMAFSPDATRLVCGLSQGSIAVWDLSTRREVAFLRGHDAEVKSITFLNDDTLASATLSEIRLWNAPSSND